MSNESTAIPADPSDPEDRPVSDEGVERGQRARAIRMARTQLGLSQAEFAERFRVPLGTLRDWEQARVMPPEFAVAYAKVIAKHPGMVAEALA